MPDLEYTVDGPVATILLNRPERKNAFTLPMIDDWVDALESARDDPEVVRLTGVYHNLIRYWAEV